MKTLNEQYKLIKEGKGHKGVFLNDAKRQFPNYIPNAATFDETATILKQKGIINENIIGLSPINDISVSKKETYELAFEKFLEEAKSPEIKAKEAKAKKIDSQEETEKAELKKPSKQVEDDLKKGYDHSDKKNLDNVIYGQMMKGYYTEMKDPKNEDKTMEQIRNIVLKNLEKDPMHYVKDGQFGVKGVGYQTEVPGLGTPKEATGKYKASGYGDLKEGKDPKVGDQVKFRGTVVTVEKKDELGNLVLKTKTGKKIKANKAQFNQYGTIEENKLRKVIRGIINEEIEEIIHIRPSKSGGGGKRFPKETLTLSALDVNRINTEGENSLGWGKPHITLGEDRNIKISALLYKDLESQERGRTSREKESAKSPLGRVIGGMSQESKDALREIRKAVVRSIGADKYFTSLTPINTTTLTKTDRDTGEKREVLGSITVKNSGVGLAAKDNLKESIEKELAAINKEAETETMQIKLDKINDAIEKRKSQLTKLDEDEDMKNLTDKKKVKELEKDIKKLEQAKTKIEKMMSKGKGKKKEVLDETEVEPSPEFLKAIDRAEEMYHGGLDIEDILVKFNPSMRNKLEQHLRAGFEGTDND